MCNTEDTIQLKNGVELFVKRDVIGRHVITLLSESLARPMTSRFTNISTVKLVYTDSLANRNLVKPDESAGPELITI
jgi:hypothetical protein